MATLQEETNAINTLIANYTQTWEYQGFTIVFDDPPELVHLKSGYPVLQFEPDLYIDGSLVVVENPLIFPFQKMGCVPYAIEPVEGFKRIVERFINNEKLWQL